MGRLLIPARIAKAAVAVDAIKGQLIFIMARVMFTRLSKGEICSRRRRDEPKMSGEGMEIVISKLPRQ